MIKVIHFNTSYHKLKRPTTGWT